MSGGTIESMQPGPGSFDVVGRSDELAEGGMLVVAEAGANGVLLVRVDGEIYAVDAICTHALGYLDEGELTGFEVTCPLHLARFDVRTGEVTKRPANQPLGCYQVIERDGQILLGARR